MEPQRKAPRWLRSLRFTADDGFKGEVVDLSAVGMRLRVKPDHSAEPSQRIWPGTLTFEDGSHVRIKVRVARAEPDADHVELGLEVAEADKTFYDALPKLRLDTGEFPR